MAPIPVVGGGFAEVGATDAKRDTSLTNWRLVQVGEIIRLHEQRAPAWAKGHPHVDRSWPGNTLYAASDRLVIAGKKTAIPGGGVFRNYSDTLRLTAPDSSRSVWLLPEWMYPRQGRPPLGGHGDMSRWSAVPQGTLLQSVARGQEFVLDLDRYPSVAVEWVNRLFDDALRDPTSSQENRVSRA